jgi:hypothetical protein
VKRLAAKVAEQDLFTSFFLVLQKRGAKVRNCKTFPYSLYSMFVKDKMPKVSLTNCHRILELLCKVLR